MLLFETNFYIYGFLSLQAWIFATKYLESAFISSAKTSMLRIVYYIKWIVVLLYLNCVIIEYTLLLVSKNQLLSNETTSNSKLKQKIEAIYFSTLSIWLFINLSSTVVAIFAITKIFRSVKVLQKANKDLKFNYFNLTIHCMLLIL